MQAASVLLAALVRAMTERPEEKPRPTSAGGDQPAPADEGGPRKRGRLAKADPVLTVALKRLRELLPGDSRFGDPLSTAGDTQASLIGRRLADLSAERPAALREAGLSALQVWDAVARSRERDAAVATGECAIVFTDLVDFSSWALEAGDEQALRLLRDVGDAIEPPVRDRGGKVVKRLGDGMMAVFPTADPALAAARQARDDVDGIAVEGYRPRLRAGIHYGCPQELGGDYFGVDVNVAARVTEHAGAGEILLSGQVLEELGDERPRVSRKRLFRAKGVPKDIAVYSLRS